MASKKKLLQSLTWLQTQQQSMETQLKEWCAINSGSSNGIGLATMANLIKDSFSSLGKGGSLQPLPPFSYINEEGQPSLFAVGDAFHLRCRPEAPHQVILCGHMDTVYGAHHAFQTCELIKPGVLRGPGVSDMKGGLLVMLYALLALERSPWAQQVGYDVVISADEELGSLSSRYLLKKAAEGKEWGLDFEPAQNDSGLLAGARRGSGRFTVITKGKGAHVGRAFQQGHNAIVALSKIIKDIHELNCIEGVTVNVGVIHGGTVVNRVPDNAVAYLDVRISTNKQGIQVEKQLREIINVGNERSDCELALVGEFTRPVKTVSEGTYSLLQRTKTLGQWIGLDIQWQDCGGCCDGNQLAHWGLATIDTLGVRGGAIHTEEEYICLDSLVERAQLTALLLMSLGSGIDL
ncbi:MAG: hydrolase [Gammaproteobacteria bacterium]